MPLPAEAAPSLLLVPELPGAGGRLTLPEEESHYLTRVCRARPGDLVTVTDGRGAMGSVRILPGGHPAVVEVESCERTEPTRTAWLLAGAPEGERGDWLVEKLAELGVAVFQPVECRRGSWERMRGRMERWRRVAVAALRQSRRRFLIEIRAPLPVEEALSGLPAGGGRWVADPAGHPAAGVRAPAGGVAVGLIGPASGFTPQESTVAAGMGFVPMCLSDSRLRSETAAMAWACWWSGQTRGMAVGS